MRVFFFYSTASLVVASSVSHIQIVSSFLSHVWRVCLWVSECHLQMTVSIHSACWNLICRIYWPFDLVQSHCPEYWPCRTQRPRVAHLQHCRSGGGGPGGGCLHHHQCDGPAVQGQAQQGQHPGGGGQGPAGEGAGLQGESLRAPPVHCPVHRRALSPWSSQLATAPSGRQGTTGRDPPWETWGTGSQPGLHGGLHIRHYGLVFTTQ